MIRRFFWLFLGSFLLARIVAAAAPLGTPDSRDIIYPDDEPPSAAEVELGKLLFFDPRLSLNNNLSCAGCHNPDLGFGDGLALSRGTDGELLPRHTSSLYNLAWGSVFFWDGRATSLEEQALMPISAVQEMNLPTEVLLSRLSAVEAYRHAFAGVYGTDGITAANVGRAIAAFERTLVVDSTPFDRYMAGDLQAMGAAAVRGLALFRGKAECINCHDGPNFTDESFHNIGLGRRHDPGRGGVIDEPTLHGAFKTPGLRNVVLSAPYMHDGSIGTLEEVLHFYNRGGDQAENRSSLIRPLGLDAGEIEDLLAFLGALTQPLSIERPRIPE